MITYSMNDGHITCSVILFYVPIYLDHIFCYAESLVLWMIQTDNDQYKQAHFVQQYLCRFCLIPVFQSVWGHTKSIYENVSTANAANGLCICYNVNYVWVRIETVVCLDSVMYVRKMLTSLSLDANLSELLAADACKYKCIFFWLQGLRL